MALQSNHTFRGLNINGAYFRITHVQISRGRNEVLITLGIFASAEQPYPFDSVMCSVPYTVDTGDVVAWAYSEVKKLPEFAGAVDV